MDMRTLAYACGFTITTLSISGCGASAEDGSSGGEESRAESSNTLLPPPVAAPGEGHNVTGLQLGAPGTEYTMPMRGGTRGSPASMQGGVIYAIQQDTGTYNDSVALAYYVPSQPDNLYRNGDYFATVGPFGGSGGTYHDWQYCPSGMGAVGIQGRSGVYVDYLGLICGNVTNPTTTSEVTLTPYGGPGGQGFFDTCQNGYLMDRVNFRSAIYIDNIQGVCIKAK